MFGTRLSPFNKEGSGLRITPVLTIYPSEAGTGDKEQPRRTPRRLPLLATEHKDKPRGAIGPNSSLEAKEAYEDAPTSENASSMHSGE